MAKTNKLLVKNTEINVFKKSLGDFISLTDMLKAKDGEFATIKSQAGLNSYKISVKEWVDKTNAIGLVAKAGRYGGTSCQAESYCHRTNEAADRRARREAIGKRVIFNPLRSDHLRTIYDAATT